ncbi:hypothetical protein GCM10020367_38880 [Streptomyces sannanensis]|uniref:SMP-30/Gluconolactonase/LRE-like region domain-containing protein n=1 Tax=Streptomyces sannanensis TaxID=285536 RepID=A0ABP6SEP1_9ACTN
MTKVTHGSGKRASVKVPFPGGVAVDGHSGRVYVVAWSIADRDGTSLGPGRKTPGGQLWEVGNF